MQLAATQCICDVPGDIHTLLVYDLRYIFAHPKCFLALYIYYDTTREDRLISRYDSDVIGQGGKLECPLTHTIHDY